MLTASIVLRVDVRAWVGTDGDLRNAWVHATLTILTIS